MRPLDRFSELDAGVTLVVAFTLATAVAVAVVTTVLAVAVGGSVFLATGDSVAANPSASFSFVQGDGYVEVAHTDGEPVAADSLVVRVDGQPLEWAAQSDDGVVEEGDSLTVVADTGMTVEVRWTADSGDAIVVDAYTVQ